MLQIIMNQEKLSKLQNQVRIGGKVRLVANGYTVDLGGVVFWLSTGCLMYI